MTGVPSRRSFLILTVEQPRGDTNPQPREVLDHALRVAGIEPAHVAMEDRGDGALVVFDQPVSDILDGVVDSLVEYLVKVNARVAPTGWLRLRFTVHSGLAHWDKQGWAGAALDEAFALNDLPPVKATLRAADRAQCVLAVSDEVYQQIVRYRYRGLNPAAFRQVAHEGQVGWIMVPGYPAPPDPEPQPKPKPEPAPTPSWQTAGNIFNIDTVHHIDARPLPALSDNHIQSRGRDAQRTTNAKRPLVFVNYRGTDEAWAAAVVWKVWAERIGEHRVFLDNQSIRPGRPFDKELLAAVEDSAALLAIIGSQWYGVQPDGRRLIDDENDWVHREIRHAMDHHVPVVPVLIEPMKLDARKLPAGLAGLTRMQYCTIRQRYWHSDVAGLVTMVCKFDERLTAEAGAYE